MHNALYLGAAEAIITPLMGTPLFGYNPGPYAEEVHDDLTATVFYFKSGDTEALLVSITVACLSTALSDEIRAKLSEALSVPRSHIMLCATHTHSGPATADAVGWGEVNRTYCDSILIPQIITAATKAFSTAVPVKMGVGVGKSHVGINRRQLLINNGTTLGQNPWGPFCSDMTVISFRAEDGSTVANLIHYGAHCTATGKNNTVTRDWPGVMTDCLAELTGGITAFINGPEGDTGPRLINGKTIGSVQLMEALGGEAAQDAVRIYKSIRYFEDAPVFCKEGTLRLPLTRRATVEEAEKQLEPYKDKETSTAIMIKDHVQAVLDAWANHLPEEEYREVRQTIFRIGKVAFIGFPFEVFAEIGLRLCVESAIPYTLPLSCTNGTEGYFPTEEAIIRGGYEIRQFLYRHIQSLTHNADWHLITETLKNMEDLTCTE